MFDIKSCRTDHKDVIHDVAYDYYSQRMATCSSDQFVKVWNRDEQGSWQVQASWKAHTGSIWRVTWAHPEFGQVLATCSFDRNASVWEEVIAEKSTATMTPAKRWAKRTNLVDSRTSVTDVKFAPKHLGLILATASADGIIRIYEAPDIMNLSQWSLQHEISCKLPLSCISWNPSSSRLHSPMIAAGSDDLSNTSGGKVFIFEYSENARKWTKVETVNSIIDPVNDISFAPNIGRSYHILAVASKDVHILYLKPVAEPTGGQRLDIQNAAQFSDHNSAVWRVSWNVTGTMLATSGDDGCVRIMKRNYMQIWKCADVLTPDGSPAKEDIATQLQGTSANIMAGTTKYYKKGTISNPNQVPWH